MLHRELTASGLNEAVLLELSLTRPMPLASRVVLDSRPFVRPLLASGYALPTPGIPHGARLGRMWDEDER